MSGPVLLADTIGKAFGGRDVLRSACLRADAGRTVALVGRNGAGKSTLLKIAAGWVAADRGVVRFLGEASERPRTHDLAARGLFLFSSDIPFFSTAFTLRQHLEAVGRRFGRGDYTAAVEELGIAHALDRRPQTFSGGERRRAEVAVALHRAPACLLADEPFRGIDPKDRETIVAALRRLAGEGTAVVLTGQETDVVLDAADEVVWCESGTTTHLGAPAAARANWRFGREFLGRR